eukprot:scaffold4221_cov105-Isochrysis_galbana.AAC.3
MGGEWPARRLVGRAAAAACRVERVLGRIMVMPKSSVMLHARVLDEEANTPFDYHRDIVLQQSGWSNSLAIAHCS